MLFGSTDYLPEAVLTVGDNLEFLIRILVAELFDFLIGLEALNAPMIQAFYNALGEPSEQNPEGLVFTNEFGAHLTKPTVYREYKRIVAAIGCPDARFHDLRHSYAVAAIRAGDDIKTVQGNLGHATAAFTLDVYGHVTDQMKRESADRMERFIRTVSAG